MILNHERKPVWEWDGKSESLCPCCREPLVGKRCADRVWHWAHRPYSSEEERSCIFEDTSWALRWRLGYHLFPGWKIEVPKVIGDRTHIIHAVNPETKQVREFIGNISTKTMARYEVLMTAKNHNVCYMFCGDEWVSGRRRVVGRENAGFKAFLTPKAESLYEKIVAANQNAMVHFDGKLWREWSKDGKRTGTWFPCRGEQAMAVLKNYDSVKLPYENQPPQPSKLDALSNMV